MNSSNQGKHNFTKILHKKTSTNQEKLNESKQIMNESSFVSKDLFSFNYDKMEYFMDQLPFQEINYPNLSLNKVQSKQYVNKNNCDKYSFSIGKYLDEEVAIPQKIEQIDPVAEVIEEDQQTPQMIFKNLVTQGKITETSSSDQYEVKDEQHDEQQEYMPDSSNSKNYQYRKACQTKNITKNFGKAIITFILKNKSFTRTFSKKYNLNEKAFLRKVKSFQEKVATIRGLRSFWLEQTNPYAKEVRILSWIYLRRHSLQHIFNSRVQNIGVNIKYRIKMLESLSRPSQFTSIKDS